MFQPPESPLRIISALLVQITDAATSAVDRRAALDALNALPPGVWDALACDADWRVMSDWLRGDQAPDPLFDAGDGPWTPPNDLQPTGHPEEEAPATGPLGPPWRQVVPPYVADLRTLVYDGFPTMMPVPLVGAPPHGSVLGRLQSAIAVTANQGTDTADPDAVARRLAYGCLNPMSALAVLREWWPDRPELEAAFWTSVQHPSVVQGIHPRIARALWGQVQRSAGFLAGLEAAAEALDAYFADPVVALYSKRLWPLLHLETRGLVARTCQQHEIWEPVHVGLLDLLATTRVLRQAGWWDARDAWRWGRRDPLRASRVHDRCVLTGRLAFEDMLRVVLDTPTAETWAQIPAATQDALRRFVPTHTALPEPQQLLPTTPWPTRTTG